jgi:transposase
MTSAGTTCKVDKSWLRELVAKGFSDREIGKLMGVSRGRIHQLRHALGLPLSKDVRDAKLKKLLESGMTQTEAAVRMGCSKDAVHHHAKRQGLCVGHSLALEKSKAKLARIREGVVAGLTIAQIAESIGASHNTVKCYVSEMRRNGHPLAPRRPVMNRQRWLARNAAILEGVAQGKSDEHMAYELGTTLQYVQRLREMLTASKTGER